MAQINNILAQIQLKDGRSYIIVINNGELSFFEQNGKHKERQELELPDVFVLLFHDGIEPSFSLAKEGAENKQDHFYVINKENKIIYTSKENEPCKFCRITSDSIILGYSEIISSKELLIPQSTSALLVKNELTGLAFAGKIAEHYLFLDDTGIYHLYEEFPDISGISYRDSFDLSKTFHADFLFLWRVGFDTNVVLFNKTDSMQIHICYNYYYEWKKQPLKVNVDLSEYDWNKNIQILSDGDTLILHACKNYPLSGFTLIIEKHEHYFKLLHQEILCHDGLFDRIKLFSNSLILMQGRNGFTIFNREGKVVTKVVDSGYNYQKNRANYVIFSQWQSQYINTGIRYGVLNVENLKVVVPPNFSEIDYIVLEDSSKKTYKIKGKNDIYIKACMNFPNEKGEYNKYWGLFKDSTYLLPCFYKSIELLRVKSQCLILIETQEGLKGIFYNDKILAPCNYESIEIEGYYLKMKKTNGLLDVIYTGDNPVLFENFSSIAFASIKLSFQKTAYTCEDAVIVERRGKYGLICRDKMTVECTYDEISVINADPNVTLLGDRLTDKPIWFMLRNENRRGVYGSQFQSEICYSNVKVLDYKTCGSDYEEDGIRRFVLVLDGEVYSCEDNGKKICPDSQMEFVGFLDSQILAFYNEENLELKLYDSRGRERAYKIFFSDGTPYDDEDLDQERSFKNSIAFALYPNFSDEIYANIKYAFSFDEKKIVFNPFYQDNSEEDFEEEDKNIPDYDNYADDTDYERDTYYALGGDDYDEFRRGGGSIDDMMDEIGF